MVKKFIGLRRPAALFAALAATIGVGLWARLLHVYAFFVNPDSYYYLLLADNLRLYGRLYDRLGPDGMRFPPIGSALFKPVYPGFVAAVDFAANNLELSGHIVAVGASTATILLIYFLAARLFESQPAGLAAALLTAFSFNHIFWSGFVMGDTLSLLLLVVVLFLGLRHDRPEYGNGLDFVAGVSVALLLLSRATFVVILPVLFWLMATEFGWVRARWLTALSSGCAALVLTAALMLPPLGQLAPVAKEAAPILLSALAVLALAALVLLEGRRRGLDLGAGPGKVAADSAFALILTAPILAQAANFTMTARGGEPFYPGLNRFIVNDPLISALGVAGLVLLYRSPQRRLGVFFALSIFLLTVVYYQVAHWEGRYLIQALPFLILPGARAAAVGSAALYDRVKIGPNGARARAFFALAAALLVFGLTAGRGLTPARGAFLDPSYPAEVSRLARPALGRYPKKTILIAALPWPYYYHLRFSTWGIDAGRPDKVLRFLPKRGVFLVMDDLSLRRQFPAVAARLPALKNVRVIGSFSLGSGTGFGYYSAPGPHRVVVYELDYDQLAAALKPERRLP